jgi:hypothetical protein
MFKIGCEEFLCDKNFMLIKRNGKGLFKTFPDKDGYQKYSITVNGKSVNLFVHRVVWELAKGPIPAGFTVDHINNDKQDNRVENLQLLSNKENVVKGNAKNWFCVSPENKLYVVYNLQQFCKDHGLHQGHMSSVAHGKPKYHQHKGWKCYVAS